MRPPDLTFRPATPIKARAYEYVEKALASVRVSRGPTQSATPSGPRLRDHHEFCWALQMAGFDDIKIRPCTYLTEMPVDSYLSRWGDRDRFLNSREPA